MRNMVGGIINECVEGIPPRYSGSKAGAMTMNFGRTLDWLVQPDTGFPNNLNIRNIQLPSLHLLHLCNQCGGAQERLTP